MAKSKNVSDTGVVRKFATGATRDTAEGKADYEGFFSPLVFQKFGEYMTKHRKQTDGSLRDSDNWQKGIDLPAYMKSLKRHCDDTWCEHRGFPTEAGMVAALCGIMFNSMGFLHEVLKGRDWKLQDFDGTEPTPEMAERLNKMVDDDAKS
jgi:hypothetical protein